MNDILKSESAEYRYYAKQLDPNGKSVESLEKVDLNQWAELLDTKALFANGGRYGIVAEHFANHKRAEHLLEIGCGSGVCVAYMQRFAANCYGADIYLCPHLRQERLDSCKFVEVNANNEFPMQDGSFDVVVTMMVMEHVFDPFYFCQEVSRILRPSGVLFLNVPLITAISHRFTLLRGDLPVTSQADWFMKRAWDGAHLHYFTLPLLKKLLGLYGFEVTSTRGVGRFHGVKTLLPTLLSKEISLRAEKRR